MPPRCRTWAESDKTLSRKVWITVMGGRPQSVFPGEQYGRLTVVCRSDKTGYFVCTCECGQTKHIYGGHLRKGKIKSCGCLHRELASQNMTCQKLKHGMAGTKIYGIWSSMIGRCRNPYHHAYKSYGARGITINKRWLEFDQFYKDMGDPPPKHSLERIDNNKGYTKDNCKWATTKEQMNNRRSCKFITFNGTTQSISMWADSLKVPRTLLYDRLNAGWSIERTFTEPKRQRTKK